MMTKKQFLMKVSFFKSAWKYLLRFNSIEERLVYKLAACNMRPLCYRLFNYSAGNPLSLINMLVYRQRA